MAHIVRTLCLAGTFLLTASLSSARADLAITFIEVGSDVKISVSGSGTIDTGGGANPGATLDFLNFTPGNPFSGAFASSSFSLSSDLIISGTDANNGGAAYTSNIGSITLNNGGAGGSDVDLVGDFSIMDGDTYSISGTATVIGLSFSDLVTGVYSASTTAGDAADFGTVSMTITSTPEPASLAMMGLAACGLLIVRRKRLTTTVDS